MTFKSDPTKPGSDAFAMLDEQGARILGPRFEALRQQMLAIRKFTAETGSWTPSGRAHLARILEPGGVYDQRGSRQ